MSDGEKGVRPNSLDLEKLRKARGRALKVTCAWLVEVEQNQLASVLAERWAWHMEQQGHLVGVSDEQSGDQA